MEPVPAHLLPAVTLLHPVALAVQTGVVPVRAAAAVVTREAVAAAVVIQEAAVVTPEAVTAVAVAVEAAVVVEDVVINPS